MMDDGRRTMDDGRRTTAAIVHRPSSIVHRPLSALQTEKGAERRGQTEGSQQPLACVPEAELVVHPARRGVIFEVEERYYGDALIEEVIAELGHAKGRYALATV